MMRLIQYLMTHRNGRWHFAFILIWLLLAIGITFLALWGKFPGNSSFMAIAAISLIWLAMTLGLVQYRVLTRYIRPVQNLEKFAEDLARGEFPAQLKLPPRENEPYADLIRSLNQLRDRMRHYQSRYSRNQQREQDQQHTMQSNSELRSRILTNLAPELRIPFNAVGGYAWLLRNRTDSPERAGWIDAIEQNMAAAEMILERIVDIGELSGANDSEPIKSAFDTAAFVRQLTEFNTMLLRDREIRLINRFSADVPETLKTDQEQLRQLLTILLRALGHTVAPGDSIEFCCEKDNRDVVFRIRDAGEKRHRNTLVKLFREYHKGNTAQVAKGAELSVLGLLFVETQAPLINARLEVSDRDETGTELALYLNHAVSDSRTTTQTIHFSGFAGKHIPPRSRTAPAPALPVTAERPLRLLLVDYDRELATILKYQFPRLELTVLPQLEKLPKDFDFANFDAALLATALSAGTRHSDVEKFLNQAATLDFPVIAILTDHSESLCDYVRKAGACAVMTKPLDYDELQSRLNALQLAPPDQTTSEPDGEAETASPATH